jgi:hypothetical protein
MPNQLTPEWSIGKKKHFPVQSSLSGYTPEQTVGKKKKFFPAAQSHLTVSSTESLTPEKDSRGAFFPARSKVST